MWTWISERSVNSDRHWLDSDMSPHGTCFLFWMGQPPLDKMAHDDTEQGVGTNTKELAAFELHEELDEHRGRIDGKPESDLNLNLYGTCSLMFRFSGQPSGYVDLWTMEAITSKNKAISLWFAYDMYNAFGCLVQGSTSHSWSSMPPYVTERISPAQIFEHLHPIDLYHISCTNHSFHNILHSPSSSSIWWAAYEREHEIPRCPPDISELEWADLLFRKWICQVSLVW